MAPPDPSTPLHAVPGLAAFTQVLAHQGVHAALSYLNRRTTHRYTGIFCFDGQYSRNVWLFDRYAPHVQHGQDIPLTEAFCALVGR